LEVVVMVVEVVEEEEDIKEPWHNFGGNVL
jgi:hypothetical protein